jgi:hypothetical protein
VAVYRPDEVGAAALVESIAVHADVDPVPDTPTQPRTDGDGNGRSPVAAAVIDTVGTLNRRVGRATRWRLSLGVLVPLALTLWAIRDATRGPMRSLPWSTALWYAHGLFRDYNLPPTGD